MINPIVFAADPKLVGADAPYMVALLDSIEIHELRSRDGADGKGNTRDREGVLGISIGEQRTLVSWATDHKGALTEDTVANLRDRVLFIGRKPHHVDLSLDLVESDARLAKDLQSASTAIGAVASVVTVVPAVGTAVGGALGFLANLLARLKSTATDRKELWTSTTLFFKHPPAPEAAIGYGTLTLSTQGKRGPAIVVNLRVLPLRLPDADADAPTSPTQIFVDEVRVHGIRGPGTLALELAFGPAGETTYSQRISTKEIRGEDAVLGGLSHKLVYDGPGVAGVPFRLAAAVVPRVEPEQVQSRLTEATDVATTVGGFVSDALPKDKQKAIAAKALDVLQKAIAGAGQIAVDLIGRKAESRMLSIEGVLLPGGAQIPATASTLPSLPDERDALVTFGSEAQGVTIRLRVRGRPPESA
jgi:hypothetical protein